MFPPIVRFLEVAGLAAGIPARISTWQPQQDRLGGEGDHR